MLLYTKGGVSLKATRMTVHALERTQEGNRRSKDRIRSKMAVEDIIYILDSDDQHILLGRESGTNRVHKLFYSNIDDECFVAVQDEKTGEVITILPVHWHNRWRISEQSIMMAKHITGFGPKPNDPIGLPSSNLPKARRLNPPKARKISRMPEELPEPIKSVRNGIPIIYLHQCKNILLIVFQVQFMSEMGFVSTKDIMYVAVDSVVITHDPTKQVLTSYVMKNQAVLDFLRETVEEPKNNQPHRGEVLKLHLRVGNNKRNPIVELDLSILDPQ